MYVSEQVLKNFDLSDEEIEFGLVGGAGDGGVDGIYVFVNGKLAREDFEFDSLKKNIVINIFIIQSKRSTNFKEETIHRFSAVTKDLFNLANKVDSFKNVYNESIRSAIENFRRIYTGLASKFPKLHFKYVYATRGDSLKVDHKVQRKADDLKQNVIQQFSDAHFEFSFYGASDLLKMARQQPTLSHVMNATDILSTTDAYIALVPLQEFNRFVRDERGLLRENLFEANVRDYQGDTGVNEDIQKTLMEPGKKEEFWWLNNGITIVASKAVQSGKTLTIEDPQIVNGQQTSTEIFNCFSDKTIKGEDRSLMVRIIVATKPESRDRIIKATNSQNPISPASLRATEKLHRDIEEYFRPFGLFYDRRKNSQKNQGKPIEKIISIPFFRVPLIFQAAMASISAFSVPCRCVMNFVKA